MRHVEVTKIVQVLTNPTPLFDVQVSSAGSIYGTIQGVATTGGQGVSGSFEIREAQNCDLSDFTTTGPQVRPSQSGSSFIFYGNSPLPQLPLGTCYVITRTTSINLSGQDDNLCEKSHHKKIGLSQKGIYEVIAESDASTHDTQKSIGTSRDLLNLKLYPNPSSDRVNVDISHPVEGRLVLRNAFGLEVLSETISSGLTQLELEIGHLASGLYVLTISDRNTSEFATARLVKE